MYGRFLTPFLLMLCVSITTVPEGVAQSRGPLLVISPSPVDFDTVFCESSRCMDVSIRNEGDTALTVQQFDALVPPFQGGLPTPLTLLPGESRTVSWCYAPTRVLTRDSISVRFVSDNRIPYSIGILLDMSEAMGVAFPGAATAISAAHDALAGFAGTMMADGSPQHEGAVFAYSTSSQFRLLRGLTTDRGLVQGSIPGSTSGSHACVWQGMDRAISLLQAARHRRVLVVVNGSDDAGVGNCGPYSAPGVANAATAADMIVCAISINGAAQAALADIAAQTGGLHRSVATVEELGQAVHAIMLHLQRSVRQNLIVRGEVVSPSLAFVPSAMLFPTTLAGDTARKTVWLRNVGTSPMEIRRLDGETDEFSVSMTARQLLPGDSLDAVILFHPADQSFHRSTITAAINGCDPARPALALHGMSYLPVNPDPGPVLAAGNPIIDGGRIPCDVGGGMTIPLRNTGSSVLHVFEPTYHCTGLRDHDRDEWFVDAGAEDAIRPTLDAGTVPGPDSCLVSATALSRLGTSTMVVIDAASTLRLRWVGLDGTDACRLAIGRLLSGMSATAELNDRLGVITASMTGSATLRSMTTDRDLLASTTPVAGNRDTTALLAAIEAAVDTLERYDGIRRLIILSAGSTDVTLFTGRPSIDALIRRVQRSGVRITAVSLGQQALSDSLRAFIDGCGEAVRTTVDPDALDAILADVETRSVDTVRPSWLLRWTNISSDISLSTTELVFDESHVAGESCAEITVSNPGEVPLRILAVTSETEGFSCGSQLPLVVPAGGSSTLRLCFAPSVLGAWALEARIHSNSCLRPSVTLTMSGKASDSNAVLIAGERAARPGGIVILPVRMDHALPAVYDVRRLTLRIAYDPSLLYPDMDRPLLDPAGGTFAAGVTVTQEYDRSSGRAMSAYDITMPASGPPLATAAADHALFSLRLRAFLGRNIKTDVEFTEASFPASAVALGFGGTATVRLDSMLWLDQRLIDASALWGELGKNAPNPSTGLSRIGYSLSEARSVRLALYDLHGRLLRVVHEGETAAGTHQAEIDTRGLPSGAYFCRLESAAGAISRVILVSNLASSSSATRR